MTDTLASEPTIPRVESAPPIPEAKEASPIDRAIESGESTAIEAVVDSEARDAVVGIKDYTGFATDPDAPEVSAAVRAQADAIEAQILSRSGEAKSAIQNVLHPEAAPAVPAAEPAVPAAEPSIQEVDEEFERMAATASPEAGEVKAAKTEVPDAEEVAAGEVVAEQKTEAAAEGMNAEEIFEGFTSAVQELVQAKGSASPELQARFADLVQQRARLRSGTGPEAEAWKAHDAAIDELADSYFRFLNNPVGMLQALDVYMGEHPEIAKKAGIDAGAIEIVKKQKSTELLQNLPMMQQEVSMAAKGLLIEKGEVTPMIMNRLMMAKEELDFVTEHEGEKAGVEFQKLKDGVQHLREILEDDEPVERLKGLLAFAVDDPEMAKKFDFSAESIQATIREISEPSAKPPSAEAGVAPTAVEAPEPEEESEEQKEESPASPEELAAMIAKFDEDADAAFGAGNVKGMKEAVAGLSERLNEQISNREERLKDLYAIPPSRRTEMQGALLMELEAANERDEKNISRRNIQLEILPLQQEQILVEESMKPIQDELKAIENFAAPNLEHKAELEQNLAKAEGRAKELEETIGKKEAMSAELLDDIAKLNRVIEKAKAFQAEEQKREAASLKETEEKFDKEKPHVEEKEGMSGDEILLRAGQYLHEPGDAAVHLVDWLTKQKPDKKKDQYKAYTTMWADEKTLRKQEREAMSFEKTKKKKWKKKAKKQEAA